METGRNWSRYVIALIITAAIFATAIYISNTLNERRVAQIETIEEQIAIDTLSLETQFDLLGERSCSFITEDSVLSSELNDLAARLAAAEGNLGIDDERVVTLRKQYTLLQIKDYLLMKEVADKCGLEPVFILYFYSNAGDCPDCEREGHVLTYYRERFPNLRVYSFDFHLDLGALRTLASLYRLKPELPALVINDKVYYGYQDRDAIEKIVPELKVPEQKAATTTE